MGLRLGRRALHENYLETIPGEDGRQDIQRAFHLVFGLIHPCHRIDHLPKRGPKPPNLNVNPETLTPRTPPKQSSLSCAAHGTRDVYLWLAGGW